MERPQSELGSLTQEIIADLERIRPGWPIELPAGQIQTLASERAHARLLELCQERDIASNQEQLRMYQREVDQILLPRYSLLAQRQNQAELSSARPWRAGDLYNRIIYSIVFFAIGLFVVWAPFIPIWDKWIPFVFALFAPFVSPLLPDIHRFLAKRRHQLALISLQYDLDQAGLALPETPVPLFLDGKIGKPPS